MKNKTVQEWIKIDSIFENGIIKLNNNKYIKILKINPINFNLKSDFEKESILSSYKNFLKTCIFDIQILIQSNKENLEKNINIIQSNLKKENKKYLNEIGNNYIKFIEKNNSLKNSATKEFYIIISEYKNPDNNIEEIIIEKLNNKYFKIKDNLFRCGNTVKEINNKNEIISILNSFFNYRLYFFINNKGGNNNNN